MILRWYGTILGGLLLISSQVQGQSAAFVHEVNPITDLADNGLTTVIDHPSVNGKPEMLLFVQPILGGWNTASPVPKSVLVDYDYAQRRWKIVSETGDLIESRTRFNVLAVPPGPKAFVQRVSARADRAMIIDHPSTNGNENARVFFTKRSNNQLSPALRNPQAYQIDYRPDFGKWMISSVPGARGMYGGDGFNFLVVHEGDRDVAGFPIKQIQHNYVATSIMQKSPTGLHYVSFGRNSPSEDDVNDFVFMGFRPPTQSGGGRIQGFVSVLFNDGWQFFDSRSMNGPFRPIPDGVSFYSMILETGRSVSTGGGGAGTNTALPNILGQYERQPVTDPWHRGSIRSHPLQRGSYLWSNSANRSWQLTPDRSGKKLNKPPGSPYQDLPNGKSFDLVVDSAGRVQGFNFNGEFYKKTR